MKRRLLIVLILVFVVVGIVGCGKNEDTSSTKEGKKAKETLVHVIDNNGDSIDISLNDLIKIDSENSARFDEEYIGATIEFEAKIEKVSTNVSVDLGGCSHGIDQRDYNSITFSSIDGVTIVLGLDWTIDYNLSQYNKGDKVRVVTNISNTQIKNGEKILKVANYDGPRGKSCIFNETPSVITKIN